MKLFMTKDEDLYDKTIEEAENDPRVKDIFEIQKAGSEFSADVQDR